MIEINVNILNKIIGLLGFILLIVSIILHNFILSCISGFIIATVFMIDEFIIEYLFSQNIANEDMLADYTNLLSDNKVILNDRLKEELDMIDDLDDMLEEICDKYNISKEDREKYFHHLHQYGD